MRNSVQQVPTFKIKSHKFLLCLLVIQKEDRGDSVFTLGDDYEYRHVHRHLKAALRSDDFAAGPFLSYLTEHREDEDGMFALCYWQDRDSWTDRCLSPVNNSHFRES